MIQRNTVMVILPRTGATVHLYEFLTHKENQDIKKEALKLSHITIAADGKKPDLSSFDTSITVDLQNFTLTKLIHEIIDQDGSVITDIPSFIDNLPSTDGELLLQKVDELTNSSSLSPETKKK